MARCEKRAVFLRRIDTMAIGKNWHGACNETEMDGGGLLIAGASVAGGRGGHGVYAVRRRWRTLAAGVRQGRIIAVRAARAARSIDCVIGDDMTLSSILAESDDEVQSLLKVLVH